MDAFGFLGFLAILIGMAIIGFLLWRRKQRQPTVYRSRYVPENPGPDDTVIIPPPTRHEELVQAKAQQTVTLLGEPERAILASITFEEMFQRTPQSSWEPNGNESKALVLSGDVWIFKIPSREGGKPTWLRGTELDTPGLGRFYKGSDTAPGPARIFKTNDQSEPVAYMLPTKPRNLTPGVTWEVVDIGRFRAQVSGHSDNAFSGDNFPFVTSRERGGHRWLIYLDHRPEDARGSGGLFICEPFEPSVDVTEMM